MKSLLSLGLLLLAGFLLIVCNPSVQALPVDGLETTAPQVVSPLVPSTPLPVSVVQTTAGLIYDGRIDIGGYVDNIIRQNDTMTIEFSMEGEPRVVQILRTTPLWDRRRISLADVRPGQLVSIFGEPAGGGIFADSLIVIPEPITPFSDRIHFGFRFFGIGRVESISVEKSELRFQMNGASLLVIFRPCSRFYQQASILADALTVQSFFYLQGRPMADTLASTVEVEQMIVLDKPSPDQSTTVQLVCSPQDGVLQCTDPQLRLEFAYPESWGLGTTTLTPSHYCGYSYVYRFDNSSIIAGGRSNPIAEPGRGGMITDFNGFGQRTRQQVCEDLSAAICEEIQPGVLLLIRVPSAESLCNGPGPGSFFAPEAIVVVDLPRSKTINGLVFVSGFVSEQLALTFPPLRPNNSRSGPATCSEASMARFNTTMQELTEQIKRDTVDEETRTNLVALRTLAQSFQGDSLRR